MTDNQTVLVLGATGKVGRRLVPLLLERGVSVRAASRHPGPDGAHFEWQRPETHRPVLRGADAVFLVGPELVEDPSPLAGPFLDLAVEVGVSRIVLLSSMGVDLLDGGPEPGHRKVERQVMASGLEWTFLRPGAFMQNLSEGFQLPGIVEHDAVVAPTGSGATAMVDAGDIAAVAAAVLTEDGHNKAEYTLTGPAPLTYGEAAERISAAAGRPIVHHDIEPQTMTQMMVGSGMPEDYATFVLGTLAAIRDGHASTVSDHVEKVTGRPATPFADFVRRSATAWARS